MSEVSQSPSSGWAGESETMLAPEAVTAMLQLRELGWGVKRIAKEFGCSKTTVRRWLRAGGFMPYRRPRRSGQLDHLEAWLAERFRMHRGNADVVRQELEREHGIVVSLRTVERAVKPLRRRLAAEARATVRFETTPGQQLQIDFGERRVWIGDEPVRVHLFVATLGYSRRLFMRAFLHQRQSEWMGGIEAAFQHFGGVPAELLVDNARALVEQHDVASRTVVFNAKFQAFAGHWDVKLRACAPYRARTKGKDESGVGYVKKNAIAGRRFGSWGEFEAHLEHWTRTVADVRVHGTTGERPIARFSAAEAAALRPLAGRPPFLQSRELTRRVQSDACIEIDTNAYSVPWRLIGESVRVTVEAHELRIFHGQEEVAVHPRAHGRRERRLDRRHLVGIVGAHAIGDHRRPLPVPTPARELLRPLAEYALAEGGQR